MKYRLGIDVGGTNTDAVLIDEDIRGCVCCEVEHLQIDIGKLDSHNITPFLLGNRQARLYCE